MQHAAAAWMILSSSRGSATPVGSTSPVSARSPAARASQHRSLFERRPLFSRLPVLLAGGRQSAKSVRSANDRFLTTASTRILMSVPIGQNPNPRPSRGLSFSPRPQFTLRGDTRAHVSRQAVRAAHPGAFADTNLSSMDGRAPTEKGMPANHHAGVSTGSVAIDTGSPRLYHWGRAAKECGSHRSGGLDRSCGVRPDWTGLAAMECYSASDAASIGLEQQARPPPRLNRADGALGKPHRKGTRRPPIADSHSAAS